MQSALQWHQNAWLFHSHFFWLSLKKQLQAGTICGSNLSKWANPEWMQSSWGCGSPIDWWALLMQWIKAITSSHQTNGEAIIETVKGIYSSRQRKPCNWRARMTVGIAPLSHPHLVLPSIGQMLGQWLSVQLGAN